MRHRCPVGVTVVIVGELPGSYLAGTLQSQRARIWLCGPLRVELDERRVEALLPARQGRLLFAYLVLWRRRPVGRDELVEALWPQRSPTDAQGALNTLVGRLRAALGPRKVAGRSELSLVLGPDPWIDVEVAQTAVTAARAGLEAGSASEAWSCAEEALGIVEQPLLRDLDRPWLDDQRRLLEALRPALLAVVGQAGLALGGSALARGTEAARELAALEPFRESARALLMRLLASGGDIAEAVRVYDDLRIHLRDELGLIPSPQLTALHERLLTAPEAVIAVSADFSSRSSVQVLQRQVLEQSALPAVTVGGASTPAPRRALPGPLQPAVGQLPFTGREQQLAFLADSWGDVDAGARRVILISGEAGIGKTRAAAELAARVHDEGSLVLYGRCDEGLAVPYQPFVEALRSLFPMLDVDQVRGQLGGLAPELGRLLPELTGFGSPPTADAESARFALFEAVVALLEVATAQQRTLLVIDDVQWAAPATLLLLRHVIRSQRPLALLIVVTFRSTELQADEPLTRLLADLQRDNSAQRIALRGLNEQAIDTLLRAAIGPALADRARLVATVHAQTAGNPFFVRELVAHLLESDALAATGEDPASAALLPAKLDIPEGLRGVVRHRVARLSPSARQLMTITSVAAGTIDVSLLESLVPQHRGLLDALDEAVAAGLLVESGRGEFDFAHALVRQAVYEDLSTARRLHLHRRLGEAHEAHGDTHEHVEALAHHFAQLAPDGETDKATRYAIAAGHAASARLAYEDAAAHFQRGHDLLTRTQEPDARRHIDLLMGLGHTRWSTGEPDKARDAFKHAADIAHALSDATAAAEAALGFSGPFFEVEAASSQSSELLLQRALSMLDERDTALRARLMGRLAAARAFAGGQHDQRALASRALAMARRANDKHALADVLATCYWLMRGPDLPDHHLHMARELTHLAEEVGDIRLLAYGRVFVIGQLIEQGDLDGALRERDALQQLAQTRNDRYVRWLLAVVRAMLAHIRGELGPAESLATDAVGQWADRPHFGTAARIFGVQIFLLRREQRRLDELLELVSAGVEQDPEVPGWRCALAFIYADLGDRDRARRELDLLGEPSSLPRDAFWTTNVTMIGAVASFLGNRSRSGQAYELLLPYVNTCLVSPGVMCTGSTSRPLGMLATTLGRYDDAEQHFKDALGMNAKIRSPLWTAHTQYEYARMLRLRAGPGDRDRARSLLMTASVTATELGLDALRQRASAEARLTETD